MLDDAVKRIKCLLQPDYRHAQEKRAIEKAARLAGSSRLEAKRIAAIAVGGSDPRQAIDIDKQIVKAYK